MTINENLQNAVEGLKDAKSTIASALSNIDGIDANSGLGTIAKQVNGKTSIYDTSDATSGNESKVLDGTTFYDQLGSQTGTMPNRGAISQNVGIGGSYTIPAGYHNGRGKVTGPTLNLGSSIAASASQILSGYAAFNTSGTKLSGAIPTLTHSYPDIRYNERTKQIYAVNYDSTNTGYFPSVGDTAHVTTVPPADLEPNKNLKAENIKSGVSIFGVSGTYSGIAELGYLAPIEGLTPLYSTIYDSNYLDIDLSAFCSHFKINKIDITKIIALEVSALASTNTSNSIISSWTSSRYIPNFGIARIHQISRAPTAIWQTYSTFPATASSVTPYISSPSNTSIRVMTGNANMQFNHMYELYNIIYLL